MRERERNRKRGKETEGERKRVREKGISDRKRGETVWKQKGSTQNSKISNKPKINTVKRHATIYY